MTNHSSWALWLQPAYGYDAEGPLAGVRYDAYTLTKEDGKGKWWEGLDPQDLYTGQRREHPRRDQDRRRDARLDQRQHQPGQEQSHAAAPFCENWFLRCRTWWTNISPDVLYFDTNELPLEPGRAGCGRALLQPSAANNGGKADVVVNGKHIFPAHIGAFVEDIERSTANAIRPDPWQTDTCIGDWHYSRAIAEDNRYATVATIVGMLTDIVSKNGNLMLNIPLRGDGSIDEHEEAFLAGLTAWMDVNSEGIYATRPWKIYGEGPPPPPARPRAAADAARRRPTRPRTFASPPRASALYAFVGAWPESRVARIKSLADRHRRSWPAPKSPTFRCSVLTAM